MFELPNMKLKGLEIVEINVKTFLNFGPLGVSIRGGKVSMRLNFSLMDVISLKVLSLECNQNYFVQFFFELATFCMVQEKKSLF